MTGTTVITAAPLERLTQLFYFAFLTTEAFVMTEDFDVRLTPLSVSCFRYHGGFLTITGVASVGNRCVCIKSSDGQFAE